MILIYKIIINTILQHQSAIDICLAHKITAWNADHKKNGTESNAEHIPLPLSIKHTALQELYNPYSHDPKLKKIEKKKYCFVDFRHIIMDITESNGDYCTCMSTTIITLSGYKDQGLQLRQSLKHLLSVNFP